MNSKEFGIISGLISALVFVLMGLFIKRYGDANTTSEVAAARAVFVMLVLLPFCFSDAVKIKTLKNKTLWMRCIFGAVGIAVLIWLLFFATIYFQTVGIVKICI